MNTWIPLEPLADNTEVDLWIPCIKDGVDYGKRITNAFSLGGKFYKKGPCDMRQVNGASHYMIVEGPGVSDEQ